MHQLILDDATRARISRSAIIALLEVATDWQLDEEGERALAGYPAPPHFKAWSLAALEGKPLSLTRDRLLRLGAVCAIHNAVSELLVRQQDRITWLTKPSRGPACHGRIPLEILSDPEDHVVLEFRKTIERWRLLPGLSGYRLIRLSGLP